MPDVTVFALGGTIAMTATEGGGVAPALSAAELLAALPDLRVHVSAVDFRNLPGASLSFADIHAVSVAIDAALKDANGIVITQGTDTIEETAYLLDLWHGGPLPIVVTGAMRNPTQASHDGPANLHAAIRTAASPDFTGLGALVVMNDEIHAARRVRKGHSTGTGAFCSPDSGPVGRIVAGHPTRLAAPPRSAVVPRPAQPSGARVGLYLVGLGDEGDLLAAAQRLDGLVVAAMGAGHVPEPLVPVLQELAARYPVVLASRTGAGPVLTDTYAFPGSERDLITRGLIPAGFLSPLKARVLLYAALSASPDRASAASAAAVAAAFAAAG